MMEKISDAQLQRLSDSVARHLGLHFPSERRLDLLRGVCAAALECGCQHDLNRYVEELLLPAVTPKHLQVLANYLTVGETYFFREKRSLRALEKDIVPELIRTDTGRALKIWSAGCATGEEAYSVAILLSKLMAGLERWTVEILATDLNSKSLLKASEGIYGEWSFRGVPPSVRNAYFEPVEEHRWAISSLVKKMVSFAQLNLMDDSLLPPSSSTRGFDVIICRNVLMYFTPQGMRKVVRRLYRSLANEGWLIVSPTETSRELFSDFASVDFGGVTLYRKSATLSGKTLTLRSVARGENEFPQPLEHRLDHPEPVIVPVCHPGRQSKDHEIHLEAEESTNLSWGQASALRPPGRYEDVQPTSGTLPEQNTLDAPAMLLVARTYANEGNLTAALAWCDRAIASDKMAARAYYLRATILQEQGSLPEALFAFKQTVYAEPQFLLGHFALGNLALHHGKLKESQKHFENVLLLLAQYDAEDIVPESEGLSAGRLREMIISRSAGMGMAAVTPEAEVSQRTFRRGSKPGSEQPRSR